MHTTKRILMLLDNPLKSDSRVEREMKALAKAGHDVTVLATNEDPSLPAEEETESYRVVRRLNTAFKAPYRKGYGRKNAEAVELILGSRFDVLHCHDYHMLIMGAAAKKRLPGITLLYDAHEYLRGAPLYLEARGVITKLKAFLVWKRALKDERTAVRAADRILTITNSIAAKMKDDFGLANLPEVVRNIPPKVPLRKRVNYFHDHFKIDRSNKILLNLGTIYHTDTELSHLFETVRDTPNLKLVFMGNRPRFHEVKAQVEAHAAQSQHVFFHDYINSEDIGDYIASADIGLAHIRVDWEGHRLGFTNRFLAYSFAGLPVICTRQDECVRIGREYGHVELYEIASRASLRQAIDSMLQHYDQRTLNIPRIREEMSWETEVQKLDLLYRTIEPSELHRGGLKPAVQ